MERTLGWVVTALGAVVVLVALRDIFHTLWHPSGRSGLSRRVMAAVWRAGRPRRGRRRVSVLAGPLSMVVVVLAWVLSVVVGWTLVPQRGMGLLALISVLLGVLGLLVGEHFGLLRVAPFALPGTHSSDAPGGYFERISVSTST